MPIFRRHVAVLPVSIMPVRTTRATRSQATASSTYRIASVGKLVMLGVAGLMIQRSVRKPFIVAADRAANLFSTSSDTRLRRIQVQVVHRHGDRTPITPLLNEEYWASTMVDPLELKRNASYTRLLEPKDSEIKHNANGRGPFGKLTKVGIQQMVKLGNTLRETLSGANDPTVDSMNRTLYPHIWDSYKPLHPSNLRVISTNFLRTIQSVQGVLIGLFPAGTTETIPIDLRNTNWMIPDPQPRHTEEQAALEIELSVRPYIVAKEVELLPLAIRSTEALLDMLAPDARDADFGVPQASKGANGIQPLSWNQLAEITKCLAVRDMLPPAMTADVQKAISAHAAWRWFESFREPRLAYLALGRLGGTMVNYFVNHKDEPPMTLWSAHDSTLIGLMCLFRLEQPAEWPEYGSYLMLELLELNGRDEYVRFSLNGHVLKSKWDDASEPTELIALSALAEHLRAQDTSPQAS